VGEGVGEGEGEGEGVWVNEGAGDTPGRVTSITMAKITATFATTRIPTMSLCLGVIARSLTQEMTNDKVLPTGRAKERDVA
jgi:hypothetical protein